MTNRTPAEKAELIVVEENTKYFSASSAWVQYSDGLEHDFLPIAIADRRQTIEFEDRPIGAYLSFFFNFTNGRNETQKTWYGTTLKHQTSVILELPPEGYESEYDFQWKISMAWGTTKWKWEWLGVGWKERGLATLPLGDWDVLQCNHMEFYIGTDEKTHRIILANVTVGAYLPIGFNYEDLRVYSPCGRRTCHVINNQVYCRGLGWPEFPVILVLIQFLIFVTSCARCSHLLYKKCKAKIVSRRVKAVDQEVMEWAQLRMELAQLRTDTGQEDAALFPTSTLDVIECQENTACTSVDKLVVTNEGLEVMHEAQH